LRVDRAVVLGVSLGVYVALAMYAKQPHRFKGFVIADSRADADTPETAARRERTVEGLRRHGAGILRDRVSDLFAATTRQKNPALVETLQLAVTQQPAAGLADIALGMALRLDRRDLLPRIEAPTIVIGGEEDAVTPPEGMRELAAAIPGAEIHLIPQAGHLACLGRPVEFNHIVRGFLRRLPMP